MVSSSTSQTTVDRRYLHLESMRILNTNSLHFLTLSLLFLPLTFSVSAVLRSSSHFDPDPDPFILHLLRTLISSSSSKTLLTFLTLTLFITSTTVAAVAMITHSADQATHNKPLTFSSVTKSLSHSYTPLLSTFIAAFAKLTLISLLFALSAFTITKSVKALGIDEFLVSIFVNIIATDVLALVLVFFIVIWGSAASIAVFEFKVGFEPLRQSECKSTEFRAHSFSIVFFSGFMIGTMIFTNSNVVQKKNWASVLQVFAICLAMSMMISYYVAANTVLYVRSMVAGGDGAEEMASEEGVSGEFVAVAKGQEGRGEAKNEGLFFYIMYFLMIYSSFLPLINIIWQLW